MLEGHILQVGAGYLLEKHFLDKYRDLGEAYFFTDDFWFWYDLSPRQVKYNSMYLYSILLTTNRKNSLCPPMLDPNYKDLRNRILCWQDFIDWYAYQGLPNNVSIEQLERHLLVACEPTVNYTRFRSFLDEHKTAVFLL